MTIPSSSSQAENFSKHRAPFFIGTDYPYWKTRMTWYLQSTNLDVWMSLKIDSCPIGVSTDSCPAGAP